TPITLPYVTLGEEDTVTFEAEAAAQGFEDVNSTATLRLLQKTMRKEETALLGGNVSVALGTPASPVLSAAAAAGATLPSATYTLNGGSSMRSANATQAATLGQALSASVALVNGAVAYAWFVGAAGSESLQAITTLNSAIFNAPLLTGQQ